MTTRNTVRTFEHLDHNKERKEKNHGNADKTSLMLIKG